MGICPSSSPNSTFTLICVSAFLWESDTTVSTWDEPPSLMSRVNLRVHRSAGTCRLKVYVRGNRSINFVI